MDWREAKEADRAERAALDAEVEACPDPVIRAQAAVVVARGWAAALRCVNDYSAARVHYERARAILTASSPPPPAPQSSE